MSEVHDGVKSKRKWSKSPKAKLRRIGALQRLQATLKSPAPHYKEKDIKRMEREVETLKVRI